MPVDKARHKSENEEPKCLFGTWRHSCPLTKSTVRMGQKCVQTMFYITTVLIPSFFAPRCHALCDRNIRQFYIAFTVLKFGALVPPWHMTSKQSPKTVVDVWCKRFVCVMVVTIVGSIPPEKKSIRAKRPTAEFRIANVKCFVFHITAVVFVTFWVRNLEMNIKELDIPSQ